MCARCGRMIIPLHVPLEMMFFAVDRALNSYFMIMIMMWHAVLTVLRNILSIGIVTR